VGRTWSVHAALGSSAFVPMAGGRGGRNLGLSWWVVPTLPWSCRQWCCSRPRRLR
jgi:hypothetical protein